MVWQSPETRYEYRLINQITELNRYEIGMVRGARTSVVNTPCKSLAGGAERMMETGVDAVTPTDQKAFMGRGECNA